ncbi:MAG: phosphotransferase, partial [Flavobacteriales bacterium]|nr:phosphotransferase [Flavobacteriales bacterium]
MMNPIERAQNILLENYGIKGNCLPLVGWSDINFRVDAGEEKYILKISPGDQERSALLFQASLLQHLRSKQLRGAPQFLMNKSGQPITEIIWEGSATLCRLLTWSEGRVLASVNPKTSALREALGQAAGEITSALQDFDQREESVEFDWELANSLWTKNELKLFTDEEQEFIIYFQERFENEFVPYSKLRKSVIHNDVNDLNTIVDRNFASPGISGIVDYGDATYTHTINDLAIALAYALFDLPDPLRGAAEVVRGYHRAFLLSEEELEHLYTLVAMRLIVSITKATLGKAQNPENEYLSVSEKPAWAALKNWRLVSADLALVAFREACDFTAHPQEIVFRSWVDNRSWQLGDLFPTAKAEKVVHVDLSVGSPWLGTLQDVHDLELGAFKFSQLQKQHPNSIIAGGYLEPRMLYTTDAYDKQGNTRSESRSVHLGVDFWLDEGTPVAAICSGEIVVSTYQEAEKEYGGLIILRHQEDGLEFYTLYGHLSRKSVTNSPVGKPVEKGQLIGKLGTPE